MGCDFMIDIAQGLGIFVARGSVKVTRRSHKPASMVQFHAAQLNDYRHS